MECARVFINYHQTNNKYFLIKCNYCEEDYSEFQDFANHLSEHQMPLNCDEEGRNVEVEEEVIPEIYENDFSVLGIENKTESEAEIQMDRQEDNGNCENSSNYVSLTECRPESEDLDSDTVSTSPESKMNKLPSTPLNGKFFRLRKTPRRIMLKFIDILREHPLQWDIGNSDFGNKDRRDKSSLDLSLQLREHLSIHITPQGARCSALALIRWFKKEYVRFLACEEQDLQFICIRGEYFEKLLQFLPHKHLQSLTCNECQRRFKSEHFMLVHKHKQHNGRVPFTCRYCGRGFVHFSSHKIHENRHIKINLWPCTECLYQAASKADYHKHLATHSADQPHKCDICGLAYKTSTNLNVHKKSHSLPEYECPICQKQFFEKYRYKRHIWLHEEEDEVKDSSVDGSSVGSSFHCTICGRRFISKNTLLKHQVVHMLENYNLEGEEMPLPTNDLGLFYCDYCTMEFINNDAYQIHMKIKHKIEIK